ncbi:hypothetical protein L1049_007269 [Liquidambar formosana]|uniref:Uncharacterized protein n=1 Tax=Liquidambar formosana TaxID=63359 RepID=A0AAP0RH24_LIQFO
MATVSEQEDEKEDEAKKLLSSYLGLSFAVFLGLLPKSSNLQSRNRDLSRRLLQAEEQLKHMKSRRKEDSKANARVVEIFASHRNAWQLEEKRLLHQIDASAEEIVHLRARVAELEKSEAELKARVEELARDVGERDEMINFMSRKTEYGDFGEDGDDDARAAEKESAECGRSGGYSVGESGGGGECYVDSSRFGKIRVSEEEAACFLERNRNAEEVGVLYGQHDGFNPDFLASASKFWAERATLWEDVQYESLEPPYHMKHFVARRESPWKVDGESTGVSSKLKLLEQELLNLERIGENDLLKLPSLMRKQAKRYQALAGKIDDLCRECNLVIPVNPP